MVSRQIKFEVENAITYIVRYKRITRKVNHWGGGGKLAGVERRREHISVDS